MGSNPKRGALVWRTPVFIIAFVFFSGCGGTATRRVDVKRLTHTNYPPKEPSEVEIVNGAPARPAAAIADITVAVRSPMPKTTGDARIATSAPLGPLRETAASLGADAVVNLRLDMPKQVPFGYVTQVTGLAVKYKDAGPEDESENPFATAASATPSTPDAGPASDVDKPGYSHPENANDYALVVGIDKYAGLPRARFAERDAAAVRAHLIALGYPPRNIIALSGPDAGRAALVKYLESWLPRNVDENSRVFFYFSGHGAPDAKTGLAYLVPWDGDTKSLDSTGYPVKSLYSSLNTLKAKEVIVAMDSGFSGTGGRSVLAEGARPPVTQIDDGTRELDKLTVFLASAKDQSTGALDEQGHGLFTYYFLKGLEKSKGGATARSLYDFLLPEVRDGARRENRGQTPRLLATDEGGQRALR